MEFRATVGERPASAWTLVVVASAMLWITEQLQTWVIAVQIVTIGLSLARRTNPWRWQGSPIALNIGMFGIAGSTILLALSGKPSTVALAHFASLSQGLQLLDSRPRKSEFLLVTLSLFQVILASNLTDSLMFPPLLVVFVFSAIWTLMVHTLKMEAMEAGVVQGAGKAITPALRRMTVIASAGAILVALVLFAFLPRMRTSMLQSGIGAAHAVAGFSDSVELGDIGRIRQDRTVVLRVTTLEGEAPEPEDGYWRGLAFDSFDGKRWAVTPNDRSVRHGSVKFGISLGRRSDPPDLVQQVVREPVSGGVIFGAGLPKYVSGALLRLESDRNGGLYDPLQTNQRVRYQIETKANQRDDALLASDRALSPPLDDDRYLAVPALAPEALALAQEITSGLTSDADRASAIEAHLRKVGSYTDTPPSLDAEDGRSPIEEFLLGELSGHCEYFASGMVVLARSVGLPSRLVNGFAGGRRNPLGGFVELTRSDAHAWVEIHYENAGWVRYDPTPPDLRMRDAGSLSVMEHLAAVGSTIELWWFQQVVDFDSSDQISALKTAFGGWKRLRSNTDGSGEEPKGFLAEFRIEDSPLGSAVLFGLSASAIAGILFVRKRRRGSRALPEFYGRALALLAREGWVRNASATARDFAADVAEGASPEVARAFDAITEHYLAERFGPGAAPAADRELVRLREALKEKRPTALAA